MATLKSGLSNLLPPSFAEGADGAVYVCNGINRPQRWDGETAAAEDAGLLPPTAAVNVASLASAGTIYGDYTIYTRAIDDGGIPSNFGPAASVVVTAGAKMAGFAYTTIPSSPDSRAVKSQIWRNTHGQRHTFYLDVETASPTATSLRTDGELILQEALRYETEEGYPNAMRFTPPPTDMSVVVPFQDRLWFLVPAEEAPGSIEVSGNKVYGGGTAFDASMVGKQLSSAGRLRAVVASVESAEELTLTTSAYTTGFGATGDYYSISAGLDRTNLVQWSEPGEPESCPEVNSFVMQRDGDRLTGAFVLGGYLYLAKERHLYRLGTAGDPRNDLSVDLVAGRGCLNHRTWTHAEGLVFALDRLGCYAFDGREPAPISGPVQDFFRGRINWSVSKWFHAVHSAEEECVRFFVALDGSTMPRHSLTFHYRAKAWEVEEYAKEVTCSTLAQIHGEHRAIAGIGGQVCLLNEGVLDGPSPTASYRADSLGDWPDGTVAGTVTQSGDNWVEDSTGTFTFSSYLSDPGVVGAEITIVSGTGMGQRRRITTTDGTRIIVTDPWIVRPDATSRYQIGGIPYEIKLGSWRFLEVENQNVRQVAIHFEPVQTGTLNLNYYLDHSATPEAAAIDYDGQDGVVATAGSPDIAIDLSNVTGYARFSIDDGFENRGPAHRVIELRLHGVGGKEKIRIYSVTIDGVQPNGD